MLTASQICATKDRQEIYYKGHHIGYAQQGALFSNKMDYGYKSNPSSDEKSQNRGIARFLLLAGKHQIKRVDVDWAEGQLAFMSLGVEK